MNSGGSGAVPVTTLIAATTLACYPVTIRIVRFLRLAFLRLAFLRLAFLRLAFFSRLAFSRTLRSFPTKYLSNSRGRYISVAGFTRELFKQVFMTVCQHGSLRVPLMQPGECLPDHTQPRNVCIVCAVAAASMGNLALAYAGIVLGSKLTPRPNARLVLLLAYVGPS
jgi:hypothetical protein